MCCCCHLLLVLPVLVLAGTVPQVGVGGACQDINDCLSAPCQNGGTCTDTGTNSFSCACPTAFEGTFCQADSDDDCASNPCESYFLGGAECVDTGLFEYNCTCLVSE